MKKILLPTLAYLEYEDVKFEGKERMRPFWAWHCECQALGGIDPLARHMRSKLMQPAEDFYALKFSTPEESICVLRDLYKADLVYQHLNNFKSYTGNRLAIWYGEKDLFIVPGGYSEIFSSSNPSFLRYLKSEISRSVPRNMTDIKNLIWRNPYAKGVLTELKTGYSCKFRTVKQVVHCDDRFWKEFDCSQVKGRAKEFKDDLLNHIRDCYLEHDNPKTDPLFGKRQEILESLLPYYRMVNLNDKQGVAPHRIDKLPDPTIGEPLLMDTLKNYINILKKR